MAGTDEKSMSSPSFCVNGCGFYGSPNTEGLCSKCFRDLKKDDLTSATNLNPAQTCRVENSSPMVQPTRTPPVSLNTSNISEANALRESDALQLSSDTQPSENEDSSAMATAALASEATAALEAQASEAEPSPRKKNRCGICSKKLGLTGFNCRCGGLFCSTHRYADGHDCSFDYKTDGKNAIRKANPKVEGEKVARI